MNEFQALSASRIREDQENPPVVFLLNPISNEGHLDTYARLYSAALLNIGYRVVLVVEKDIGCLGWLGRRKISTDRFIEMHPRFDKKHEDSQPYKSQYEGNLLVRAWSYYRDVGVKASLLRVGAYLYYRLLASGYLKCYQIMTAALDKRPLIKKFLRKITPGRLRSDKHHFITILDQWICKAESGTGLKPDLVFILYVDILDQTAKAWRNWSHPWACVRFAPNLGNWCPQGGVEPFFTVTSFRGASFLNADSTDIYRKRLPRAAFATTPDVCDIDIRKSDFSMVRELRRQAKGRTIIFAGGGLTGRKGIYDLLMTIPRLSSRDYFFAIVGKVYWTTFSNKEIVALKQIAKEPPENVFVHFGYLDDERDFNALIAEADMIYAVYRDFPYSSNLMGKAAHFEIPLLVSDRYLMGKQVKEYGLGLAVPEGNVDAIQEALALLRDFNVQAGAQTYRAAHSQKNLEHALEGFLQQCLS